MTARFLKRFPCALAILMLLWNCKNTGHGDIIPSIDRLSGQWVGADTIAMEPSLRNFRGQALVNRDLASISWFASAPYSGGYHTGILKINGEVPMVSAFRWQPYQALRKGILKNLEISSSTRMLPEEDGILWRIRLINTSPETQKVHIDLDAIGFISKYGGDWQWWYPYPSLKGMISKRDDEVENVRKHIGKPHGEDILADELIDGKPTGKKIAARWPDDKTILNSRKYNARLLDKDIIVSDSETDAITGFAFKTEPDSVLICKSGGTAQWNIKLAPGESRIIEYLMAYGDDESAVEKNMNRWKDDFDKKFNSVKSIWEAKWQQMFTPGNAMLSGTFPVFETSDTLAKRVYYTGPLAMLYLMNTHLPQHKKVILTGGPKWGATISFFWDNTEWSTLQAVVDPLMLKEQLLTWMKTDPAKYYGVDNFGGKGVGNAYSANYWALFQLVRSYLTATRDFEFLKQEIDGKTVLETLEAYATHWEKMSLYGQPGCTDEAYKLADFGDDEWNLLECVPTYKHIVPSFNAGYIWMMRETAALYHHLGNEEKATALHKKADELIPLLMNLYAGNGVWNSLYPGNKTIEVRHCLDFMFMGRYLPGDLPGSMKNEMKDFLYEELMADHWMRAQSLKDVAAKNSDRPDHGPLGAYDGWPAGTMDALVQMGYSKNALDFYHAIEPVTHEGTWAQAHELWGENKENAKAKVRIAERGWHARDAMAGIGMSQVMLKCFFGFNPDFSGDVIKDPGEINLEGKLHHVLYGGEYYTITRHNGKISLEKENRDLE